jgi:hypothetical protein
MYVPMYRGYKCNRIDRNKTEKNGLRWSVVATVENENAENKKRRNFEGTFYS